MEFRHLLAELWGSFIIVFAYSSTNGDAAVTGAALLIAYSGTGLISGCHFNPAVTLAYYITKAFDKKLDCSEAIKFLLYIGMQFLGAIIGALISWGCTDKTYTIVVGDDSSISQALLAETLFTMILVSVILTMNEIPNSQLVGTLAPMFFTFAGITAVGGISGGVFNPALGLGTLGVDAIQREGADELGDLWIYFVGPLIGGVLGAFAFLGMKGGINEAWPREENEKAS